MASFDDDWVRTFADQMWPAFEAMMKGDRPAMRAATKRTDFALSYLHFEVKRPMSFDLRAEDLIADTFSAYLAEFLGELKARVAAGELTLRQAYDVYIKQTAARFELEIARVTPTGGPQ